MALPAHTPGPPPPGGMPSTLLLTKAEVLMYDACRRRPQEDRARRRPCPEKDKGEREMVALRFSGSKVSPEKWHGGDLVRWVSGVLLTLTRLSTTWQETALQRWGTNWHRPATEEFAIWSRRSRECRGLNRASQTHSCISRPKIYTSRNRHCAD